MSEAQLELELARIRAAVPAHELKTCCKDLIRIVLAPTPYRSITLILQFPPEYPRAPLYIELNSPYLHPDLVRQLLAQCEEHVRAHVATAGNPEETDEDPLPSPPWGQVQGLLHMVRPLVEGNLLLACWGEVRALRAHHPQAVTLNARKGVVRIAAREARYAMTVTATVPSTYPADPIALRLVSSNLSAAWTDLFLANAHNLAFHKAHGRPLVRAVGRPSARAEPPAGALAAGHPGTQAASASVQHLFRAMRAADEAPGAADKLPPSDEPLRRRKKKAVAVSSAEVPASEVAPGHTPVAHLEEVAEALIVEFHDVVTHTCPLCNERIFPANPADHPTEYKRACVRVYCGHIFHFPCLDSFMRSPPFDRKPCPSCGARIMHANWKSDLKQMEKMWVQKQACLREIGEINDFLGI